MSSCPAWIWNLCVCGGGTRKEQAALEGLFSSFNRAITCTTAFPSYSFWNKTGFKHLFSAKPSRRSAYFCGSFLQHHSNSFSFVFRANRVSKVIPDYAVHTCKLQHRSGLLTVCACKPMHCSTVQHSVQVWYQFILQCFAHQSISVLKYTIEFRCATSDWPGVWASHWQRLQM